MANLSADQVSQAYQKLGFNDFNTVLSANDPNNPLTKQYQAALDWGTKQGSVNDIYGVAAKNDTLASGAATDSFNTNAAHGNTSNADAAVRARGLLGTDTLSITPAAPSSPAYVPTPAPTAPQAPAPTPIPVATSTPGPAAVAAQAVAATPYDAAQAQVVNANIDPNKTSAGLLTQYTNPNDPNMVRARTSAMLDASSRGLLNSSLATSAGENAWIDEAGKYALADSSLYGNAELQNASLGTNVNVQNAQSTNASLAQSKGALTQVSISNAGLSTDVSKQNSVQAQQNNQFNASAANVASLTTAQLTNQTNIANMQSAANLQLQQIQSDTSLSIADKNIASQQLITNLNNASSKAIANIQKDTTLSVADKQSATQTAIATSDQANRIAVANIQTVAAAALQTADAASKVVLQNMVSKTQNDLATIQANYSTLIQTSASLSDTYKSTLAGIAGVLADSTINAAGKANVINGLMGNLKTMANAIGSINGVDVSKLLDFGTATG